MWIQYRLAILFTILLVGFSLNKNPFPKQDRPLALPPTPKVIKVEKWQQQLGDKIATLRQAIPTVSRVVLVPDTGTFLEAIQHRFGNNSNCATLCKSNHLAKSHFSTVEL
jgi:hypothetical protein